MVNGNAEAQNADPMLSRFDLSMVVRINALLPGIPLQQVGKRGKLLSAQRPAETDQEFIPVVCILRKRVDAEEKSEGVVRMG